MSRQVWKFELPIDDAPHLVPGKFVHAEPQDDVVFVWCEVDTDDQPGIRGMYQVFETGHDIPPTSAHRATVLSDPVFWLPPLVWHVYELGVTA